MPSQSSFTSTNITNAKYLRDLQQFLIELKLPVVKGWTNIIVYVLILAIVGFIYKEYLAPRMIAATKWWLLTLKQMLLGTIKTLRWLAVNLIHILPCAAIGLTFLWVLDRTFGWNLLNRLKDYVEVFVSHLEHTFGLVFNKVLSWKDFEL